MLNIPLPEEDGMAFETSQSSGTVAVISLPRIANLDEFAPLGDVLRIAREPHDLDQIRAIIIPGSKSTRADLEWLRTTGLAAAITRAAKAGVPILGICGGLQMLGHTVHDPEHIEGGGTSQGLGLLDLETSFTIHKITRAAEFTDLELKTKLHGYEIHIGRTSGTASISLQLGGEAIGWRNGNVRGVYAHGLLENPAFLEAFLNSAGLNSPKPLEALDARLDRIATQVQASLDWTRIAGLIQ